MYHQEFTIAFCGHFSAGKSSLINELIGDSLLPSSPIPTSANLVKVKAGKPYARVYYKSGQAIEYAAPYDYEEVKTFCRDGDTIDMIEISDETDAIPSGIVLMDTPGIDSTDDAHRLATESALHLADVIFYVMDYNHVQAELNFEFTKRLSQYGKTLYLVINQIDKHREQELFVFTVYSFC
ncbi:GTPase Der [Anoxybacillus sp. BCO1]|nr:GTPase Der [Anoxybacillus sp. BCO1]